MNGKFMSSLPRFESTDRLDRAGKSHRIHSSYGVPREPGAQLREKLGSGVLDPASYFSHIKANTDLYRCYQGN